ncbi:MAG TPA: glycosyltransferase [Casimicrobiaceae bacterium]
MIDVVVPVYRGEAATRRCLESVLAASQRTPLELVVVDDASPEPAIPAWLDLLHAARRITLLRNAGNAGFVRSVNRAIALHPERDVVLLNSDTEVANDWLDRLAACVARDSAIATATPFSNHATICSYPFNGWTGGVPGTLGLAALDRLFASVNGGQSASIPTGVGFCLYLRRACLDALGSFDAERFGRGYGEENDYCLRAAAHGWRNVVAADVFVYHEGAVSFSDEREARTREAGELLRERHPGYDRMIAEFVAADPLQPFREAVDAARDRLGEQERAALRAEAAAGRALFAEHMANTAELVAALDHAQHLVTERDAEIAKLTAAFHHAEKLALERQAELERIRRSALLRGLYRIVRSRR